MHKFEYIDRYRAAWHFFFCRASYKTTHLQCWSRSSYWLNREIKLPTEELVPTAVSSLQDQTATAILSAKPLLTSHIYFIRASASKWHSGWPKPPSLAAACLLCLTLATAGCKQQSWQPTDVDTVLRTEPFQTHLPFHLYLNWKGRQSVCSNNSEHSTAAWQSPCCWIAALSLTYVKKRGIVEHPLPAP